MLIKISLKAFSGNISGSARGFTTDKYGVLLSDKIALKLFNTTEHITGKTIEWNRGEFIALILCSWCISIAAGQWKRIT